MKLVDQITGSDREPKGDVKLGNEHGPPAAYGIDLDGERYQLDGQPPLAMTKGWGEVPGRP